MRVKDGSVRDITDEKLHHVTQLKHTYWLENAQELRNTQCASFCKAGAETEAHLDSSSVEMLVFVQNPHSW